MQKNNLEEELDELIQNVIKRPRMYYSNFSSIVEGFLILLYLKYGNRFLIDQIFDKNFEDFIIPDNSFRYKNYQTSTIDISNLSERLNNIVRELDNQIFK